VAEKAYQEREKKKSCEVGLVRVISDCADVIFLCEKKGAKALALVKGLWLAFGMPEIVGKKTRILGCGESVGPSPYRKFIKLMTLIVSSGQ
jgi:hypothetical protein